MEVCPKNTKEWQIASKRLNCANDISNPKNRYHCLPANDLSTLVEFCYNETRPGVGKGSCMLYVQKINYLNGYNCSGFRDGCPDRMYSSDESYLFPRCLEINPKRHCFVAESSCQGNTSENIQTSHSASTEASKRNDNALPWSISLVTLFLLVVIVIAAICNLKKGACRQRILQTFCANSSESPTTIMTQSSGAANDNQPFLPLATFEENKTDKKEDKQSTSDENKSKKVYSIPDQRLDSQTKSDWHLLESPEECSNIFISIAAWMEPVDDVAHISCVTSEYICLDNKQLVMKIDHKGNILSKHELGDFWGSASSTVDENGDILIIRQHNKVMRVMSNKGEPKEVLSVDRRWSILSVYFSRFTGEILVRVYLQQWSEYSTRIERYKDGKKLSGFEYHKHDKLIVYPLFLSVNTNSDIWIADNYDCHVRAYNDEGKELHSYEGSPQHFSPTGICNDLLGHVLVCNCHKSHSSVHLLDKNGEFLKMIVCDREDVIEPWGLCVDDEGKLYLGQKNCSVIKVFQYLSRKKI